MHVFDNLINNIDRNQGNILFDAHWNMLFIDQLEKCFFRVCVGNDPPGFQCFALSHFYSYGLSSLKQDLLDGSANPEISTAVDESVCNHADKAVHAAGGKPYADFGHQMPHDG